MDNTNSVPASSSICKSPEDPKIHLDICKNIKEMNDLNSAMSSTQNLGNTQNTFKKDRDTPVNQRMNIQTQNMLIQPNPNLQILSTQQSPPVTSDQVHESQTTSLTLKNVFNNEERSSFEVMAEIKKKKKSQSKAPGNA